MRTPLGVGVPRRGAEPRRPGRRSHSPAYILLMDEREVWEAARLMLEEHGNAAVSEATMKADALIDAGDMVTAWMWVRIASAINDLTATASDEQTIQ